MTKFEVGKKYRYGNRFVEECLAVTDEFAWLQAPGHRGSVVDRVHDGWKEYKEPRKVEGWVNVYETTEGPRFGMIFKTKEEATSAGNKTPGLFLDTIKVTWTEGE